MTMSDGGAAPVRFGRFEVRPDLRQVCVDGEPVRLGTRAFDVLQALIERRDRTVTKNELLDLAWPDAIVEENNLQVQVSALRKVLGPQAIATIPGRGYRFVAAIDGPDTPPAEIDAPAGADREPEAPHRLIGRDSDLAAVLELVEKGPLTTLVGPGGIGKTALARAVSAALRDRWPDGVRLVELAPVGDAAGLARAVAQALRTTLQGEGSPEQQLVAALQSQSLLLVLDNCEHLVDAVGALAEAIVEGAPGVRVLATSQELLNVPHERLYGLRPLSVPADGETAWPQTHGAVALFVERARAVAPRFELSEHAQAVADICRRLDGLPLAIELAAARVRMFGASGLRDMLDDRFRILTGGARTQMPRHQALLATIDWSHGLLAEDDQIVLRRVSVFVGGFTLELAQSVAADETLDAWAVLDALSRLVDKSLVVADGGDRPRYRLLETTRAYAHEKLASAHETVSMRERHARAVCALFERTDEAYFGEQGDLSAGAYMERLIPELGNLRAALDWAMDEGGDRSLAVVLMATSGHVLSRLGLSQEGLRRMMPLLGTVDAHVAPAQAALFRVALAMFANNGRWSIERARNEAASAVKTYRSLGSPRRLHRSLYVQAWTLAQGGDPRAAEALLVELEALEQSGWPPIYRCLRLTLKGSILTETRRYDEALAAFQECHDLLPAALGPEARLSALRGNLVYALINVQRFEEALAMGQQILDDAGAQRSSLVSYVLQHLMRAQMALNMLEDARATMRRGVPEWRRDSMLRTKCIDLALLFAKLGRFTAAARLEGVALAWQRDSAIATGPFTAMAHERTRELIADAGLAADAVAVWRQEGAAMDDAAIAALCLGADPT